MTFHYRQHGPTMDILQRLIGVHEGGGKMFFFILTLYILLISYGLGIQLMINIFLANYPETLKGAYVLNASSFFQIVFKIVQVRAYFI